ncbi:class I SAM-dependent DNA methyltransferase [Corynebacterium urealyticum]|uniref:HsdM family class I SAM-dependent methyltransferase n=1 Tax=Corynebacterium urealyticum TaxID=43771 RepID=UPI00293F13BE|nr:N-6 DNA methylase [Corynebacterium urealyticum]WOH93764.1 N-6 DNA methylase [Corynebacterium urealyticum]
MANERSTDQFVRDMLRDIGFTRPWEQSINDAPAYLYEAMEGASKGQGGGRGKPEFVVESGEFIVVIEDKPRADQIVKTTDDGAVDLAYPARQDFALNGAMHYAEIFAAKTGKKVFAIGVAGSETHNAIQVAFSAPQRAPKVLDNQIDTFTSFSPQAIDEFYRVAVLGELPQEEKNVREIRKVAAELHEGMRNYASLESEHKATLVSAILLALKYRPELVNDLTGEKRNGYRDGEKVYRAAQEYLESDEADLGPKQKIGIMLDRFKFIQRHVLLNAHNTDLGKTPLRHFAEVLDRDVFKVVSDPAYTAFDVLGNFYGEFVKYGGSDGNSLGIVLTPHHITELMSELIDVNCDDVVLDPTAGSASFLIAAMRRMFNDAAVRFKEDPDKLADKLEEIKRFQLHGVELQEKLFAVGTTNMILRGDGKANFQRNSIFDVTRDGFFPYDPERPGRLEGFTKVLMNPPYSQSKDKTTRHLSELSFISYALDLLEARGRLAAIVPQSAMVGKTREDKALKAAIMKKHTLDAVLTMNPDTFHGIGTHVVIALFTAGVPHPEHKKTAFIDFKDDGYKVRQHVGLVDDGRAEDRRKHLMSVLNDGVPDDTHFIVRTEVTAKDEWQHSYFYFNDQPPTEEDFLSTVADYVTWQVNMHTHGLGNLVTPTLADTEDAS